MRRQKSPCAAGSAAQSSVLDDVRADACLKSELAESQFQRTFLQKQELESEHTKCRAKLTGLESHEHEIWCAFLELQLKHEDLAAAYAQFQHPELQLPRKLEVAMEPSRQNDLARHVQNVSSLERTVYSLERVQLEEQVRELRQSIALLESSAS